VPPKSGTALADAIGTLLANPLEAKKIGEAAHQAVAERFSLERQAAETTSVYKSCLDDRATTWPAASWDA